MSTKRLRLTIVGLGLMGGSMAKALRSQRHSIVGVDRDPVTLKKALQDGVIEQGYEELALGLQETELIVLAVPVGQILDILQKLPKLLPSGAPVIDLGSTKYDITEAMAQLPRQFSAIGGHPMCGKEIPGYEASSAQLYERKSFVLCRTKITDEHIERLAEQLVQAIGSAAVFMSPREHDNLVAVTSHLPYLVSSTLSLIAGRKSRNWADLWKMTSSGYRDTSRLAGTDPSMMIDVLKTNRSAILNELENYLGLLTSMAELIAKEDFSGIGDRLFEARMAHQHYKEEFG